MSEKRLWEYSELKDGIYGIFKDKYYYDGDVSFSQRFCIVENEKQARSIVGQLNGLAEENEQLKNRVDELEDDNMKYTLSTDKLEDYSKRFIPTKGIGEVRDCKTNRYYDLYNEDNFSGILELLNLLDYKNEQLKPVMLMIDEKIGKGNRNYKEAYTEAKIKNIIHNKYQKEVSFILDNVFYWKGYLKALKELRDELKNGDSNE